MIRAFRVFGDPKPKGSKTTGVAKNGVRYVRESNPRTMSWVNTVKDEAKKVMGHEGQKHNIQPPFNGPVKVKLIFWMRRPKAHFTSRGELKWDAPNWHAIRPDGDKLARAVLDGLQPFVLKDDSQAADIQVVKHYCRPGMEPYVFIEVRELA